MHAAHVTFNEKYAVAIGAVPYKTKIILRQKEKNEVTQGLEPGLFVLAVKRFYC